MSFSEPFNLAMLQQALLDWPDESLMDRTDRSDDTILDRLLQILRQALLRGTSPASVPDFITLIRHLLFQAGTGLQPETLGMPKSTGWPGKSVWKQYGFHVTDVGDQLFIEPQPWNPEWFGSYTKGNHDIFQHEFTGINVRQSSNVPMDPFLTDACEYDNYICPGQREAVRSLLFMPPGETLIVNLPTGGGKSLVGQIPVVLRGLSDGLTMFVIPTTALALDLARRTQELLRRRDPHTEIPEIAWHSGCSDEVKKGIKQRIRECSQGILFASPEAVTESLLPALGVAAKMGFLKYLVVDEAHLIEHWGDSFRSAFQKLPIVRRGLLRECGDKPFRTVLMSATFTKQTVETVDFLFGPKEKVQMVSGVHLRPEPRYFSHKVQSWNEKKTRVLELLRHVPRPFILYVTKVKHANNWLRILKYEEGYSRVDSFHGRTESSRKEKIIDQWIEGKLDGIVATSAFGVGMDKSDVRTIIHAAVPETLDRYYQEVGRGGRDGKASLSIVVYDDEDKGLAKSLGRPVPISDEKLFDRWQTMFFSSQVCNEGGLRLVDISAVPGYLRQQTPKNEMWNMRTLNFMVRAGLIEVESINPDLWGRDPLESESESATLRKDEWKKIFTSMVVRTLDPNHLDREHFQRKLGARHISDMREGRQVERSFNSLIAALSGEKEMSDVLSALYTNNESNRTVFVSTVCRGCPANTCMSKDTSIGYPIPIGVGIKNVVPPQIELWRRKFEWLSGTPVVVLCPAGEYENGVDDKVLQALTILVTDFGLKEVSATTSQWRVHSGLRQLHKSASDGILIARTLEEDSDLSGTVLPLPRATLLLPWCGQQIPNHLFLLDRPFHAIFVPEDVPSNHPLRSYQDDTSNHISLRDFLRITTQ